MLPHLVGALIVLAVLGALSSIAYYCLCLWGAQAFLRERRQLPQQVDPSAPPVSILKPLKGTDPEMYESFRSHCLQDYPAYEIIFGVSDGDDPAVALVEKLKAEFPRHSIQMVVCTERLGTNIKVSNLAQMLAYARNEFLVINDSDIRVAPNYLKTVVSPLIAGAGMVTCLYRGIAAPTLGSRLESVGISTDFIAGVLAAKKLEGIHFGLGSTLAFQRRDLDAIGGFEVLVDFLADDYELGKRIAKAGRTVQLSAGVVETFLPPYTFGDFVRHQLRWARSTRDSRRWGYVGLALTFGIPWALAALLLSRSAWALLLLAITVCMRLVVAFVVGSQVVGDRQLRRTIWLVPLRDLVALFVWIVSFTGHTVAWRGDSFLLKDGKLARLPS
ncbi:MAG TPA: bacteriohopanetetrol glucosamine biosynthesis glycosyltransferase HpnI [Terriglobales bacterium]|nr:bacteriohopanetetrol glucosamine biosynthesis glycosyltransferase HpnI [Terriglobales bacterium]